MSAAPGPTPPGPAAPPVKRGRGRPKKTEEEKARDKAARLLAKAQGKTVPPKNQKKKAKAAEEEEAEVEPEEQEEMREHGGEDGEMRGRSLGSKIKMAFLPMREEPDEIAVAEVAADAAEMAPKWFDAIYAESVAQLRKALDENADWKEETW
jgi:hypothetical protein